MIAWFAAGFVCLSFVWTSPAVAQAQNLEAGKTPSQIFTSTCSLCHKSSRGMLKSVAPGALPGFLRQHYTTSSDMASAMSAFVISNGAADARLAGGGLTQQGKDSLSAPKPSATPAEPEKQERRTREARKPDGEGLEPGASGKPEPKEKPQKPDGDARQKSAKGKPPATEQKSAGLQPDAETTEERPKDQSRPVSAPQPSKPESTQLEPSKSDSSRPRTAMRTDPVPAVTPAPASTADPRVLTIDNSPAPQPVDEGASRPPAGPPIPPISQ